MGGGLSLLAAKEGENETLGEVLPGMASRAFNGAVVDDMYTCVPSYELYTADGPRVAMELSGNADIKRNFVLRIPSKGIPGHVMTQAFERFEILQGGQVIFTMSLAKNIAVAKARGLWPWMNNDPKSHVDDKEWVLMLPLMYDKFLMIGVGIVDFPQYRIVLHGSTLQGKVLLQSEACFLGKKARASSALKMPPVTGIETPPLITAGTWVYHQTWTIINNMDCIDGAHWMRLDITGIRLCYCIMILRLRSPSPAATAAGYHPINRLRWVMRSRTIMEMSHEDLEEMNWLRLGLVAPIPNGCTYTYLIPFSSDAHRDLPTTWFNVPHADRCFFEINSVDGFPEGTTLTLSGHGPDVQRVSSGMTGLLYRN